MTGVVLYEKSIIEIMTELLGSKGMSYPVMEVAAGIIVLEARLQQSVGEQMDKAGDRAHPISDETLALSNERMLKTLEFWEALWEDCKSIKTRLSKGVLDRETIVQELQGIKTRLADFSGAWDAMLARER